MKNTLYQLLVVLTLLISGWQCVQTEPVKPPTGLKTGEWICGTHTPADVESLERGVAQPPDPLSGVAAKTKLWPVGGTVKIAFLQGSQIERDSVRRAYALISAYANLNFSFVADGQPADIRVAFVNSGAWSYIGTDARMAQSGPTVNLAPWALNQRGAYVHEALHSVGMLHEQQHPNGVCLDTAKTLAFYRQNQGWSDAQIFWNVITRHKLSDVVMVAYDPGSVMHYPTPAAITCSGVGIPGGRFLTGGDIDILKKVYPGRGIPPIDPPTGNITLTPAQAAELKQGALSVQTATNAANEAAKAHRAKIQAYLGQ